MPRLKKDGTPDRRGAPKGARRRTAANDKFHNFKVCTACKEKKKLADFPKRGHPGDHKKKAADPTKYGSQCKKCKRAIAAGKMAGAIKTKATPYNQPEQKRRVRRATRIKVFEYLAEKGCCDCDERDPRVLEFDHIDRAKKKYHIADLISSGYSWSSNVLRKEILKCRVICANCHRLHTIEQQQYYSDPEVSDALDEILERYGIDA